MTERQHRVVARFPDRIRYVSEGLVQELTVNENEVEMVASITASRFPKTGVRIWHVALSPPAGSAFSEVDIVRLVSLYASEQEQITNSTAEAVRFDLEVDRGAAPPETLPALPLSQLLRELSSGALVAEKPAAGTIEFNPAAGDEAAIELWTEILSSLYLTTEDDQDGFRQLETLYAQPDVGRILNACCGVVSGVFDYARMSFAEMQDTLAPDSSAGTYAIWLNRATLANVDLLDEMLERCGRTIGVSPYLILPHAVLLHNEFVVDRAEEVAARAIAVDDMHRIPPRDEMEGRSASIRATRTALDARAQRLAEARRLIERCLHIEYVPNVFHYPGERELYEVGGRTRGALEKREGVHRMLDDIHARLRDCHERLRQLEHIELEEARAEEHAMRMEAAAAEEADERKRSFALTVVSVLLSLGVLLDIISFFATPDGRSLLWPPTVWTVVLGIAVLVSVLALVQARPRS
jgi:hypothetical protein